MLTNHPRPKRSISPSRARALSVAASATMAAAAASAACSSEPTPGEYSVQAASQDLWGPAGYGLGGCTAAQQTVINRVAFFGRAASTSNVFRECVTKAMSGPIYEPPYNLGPYDYCAGDPNQNGPLAAQTAALLATSQSTNKLNIGCDDAQGGGNASAAQENPGQLGTADEAFTWHHWLQNNWNLPEQASGWPFSQAAGILWHEVLHQEGYHHGNGPASDCGLTGSTAANFNFQVNTANYIVSGCMESIIDQSGVTCGLHSAQCPGGLMLLDSLEGNTCSCVRDPEAPNCLVTAAANGSISAQCTHDAAQDPIFIYKSDGDGGWTQVKTYPAGATGAQPILSGQPVGTTGTFLACTFDQSEISQSAWLAQIGPGGYGCDQVATTVIVPPPPPSCTPSASCSSEYYQPAGGRVGYSGYIDTITVSCPKPASVVQELVNGSWVNLAPYSANNGYPPPPNPSVFDAASAASGAGSVQVRACALKKGALGCDPPTTVASNACPACIPRTCDAYTCGTISDGCGNTLDCGNSCPSGLVCSNTNCVDPNQCPTRSCATGYYWNSSDCQCESDCLCGGKYPKCLECP